MRDMITIEKPDTTALAGDCTPLIEQAKALVVNSKDSHGAALEGYAAIKTMIKRIKEYFEPSRKALDTAKKEILRARDGMIEPLDEVINIVSNKVDVYEREQWRIAKEKADREAEAERKRQEEQRLAEAEAAEKAGDSALAEEIIDRPIEVVAPAPAQPETIGKVAGVSSRVIYKAEVTDLAALIKYAANLPISELLLEPNMPKLNELARFHKNNLAIPGVRVVTETVRPVRG